MTATDHTALDELGPIDFVVLEFDGTIDHQPAEALIDLVANGIIDVYDIAVVHKDRDGVVTAIEITPETTASLSGFRAFASFSSGLLDAEDVAIAGEELEPGRTAVVIVFENRWARSFSVASRKAGGELIAFERIPTQAVVARLDELDI